MAEQLLIAAGKPELAKALYYQAQGIRNLVQGEWGKSFVNSLENILQTYVITALAGVQQSLDQQHDLVQRILTAHQETARGLKKLQSEVKTLKDGQTRISREVADLDARHKEQWAEVIERLDADDARLDRKRKELDDHNARLERLEARAAALPESEVNELIGLLRQIAQERAGHGE